MFWGKNRFCIKLFTATLYKTYATATDIIIRIERKRNWKSIFGNLLKLLFQDNSSKLGNSELESDFNAIWVKRLAIIVD